jgi:two-component system chemotaxis response regulator CheY
MKVLVVDDAGIMRLLITKILNKLGITHIIEAETAFDAVELYQKTKPDLVTMDITMPQKGGIKDGIEAVKKIKEIDPDAKIIMITSHGEQDKVIDAIRSGASNYILKPLKEDKVREAIEALNLPIKKPQAKIGEN